MKNNDSIFVQLLRHKRDALSGLWSFIKRFIKIIGEMVKEHWFLAEIL